MKSYNRGVKGGIFLGAVLSSFFGAAAVAKTHAPKPVIVCFGDSLTAGYGVEPGHAYPDYLQEILDSHGYGYRVINQGVNGNTTQDGAHRLNEVLAVHPEIVVVEFGGNDKLGGLPIGATQANLDQIISTLQAAGVKVALAGIQLEDYPPEYIRDFNDALAEAAKKYAVPFLPSLLIHVYTVPNAMQDDHTHATAAGNNLVAQNVFALLKPLLKK